LITLLKRALQKEDTFAGADYHDADILTREKPC